MDESRSFFSCFISGGIAGASIDLTLHPLDYIKTRVQNKQKLDKNFLGFYKGMSATLSASFPCAATFWGFYMFTRQTLISYQFSRPFVESTSSIVGSLACCVVRCPFERIKQIAQTQENPKVLGLLRSIIKIEGFPGLYKGFTALVIREVPFDTIQMLIFQFLRYTEVLGNKEKSNYFYGAVAGGLTGFITTPIDVIKTMTMIDSKEYTSFLQAARKVYRDAGLGAFWRGWMIRTTYISLGGMMYFGVFNTCLMHLNL